MLKAGQGRICPIVQGLSISTLNKWRCYGFGPKYLKLGRAVRYRQEELDCYLETRLLSSTLGN